MNRTFPVILLLAWALSCPAQSYILRGSIQYAGDGTIYLASYYGDSFRVIDSTLAAAGTFQFILSGQDPAGVYRLIFSEIRDEVYTENRFVEFIFNREDLVIHVTPGDLGPMPHFDQSEENRIYSEFVLEQLEYEAGLMETIEVMSPARPGHPVYEAAARYYETLQSDRLRYMDSVIAQHPDLYATRIIRAFRTPVIPGKLSGEERIDTLQQLFFSISPISDRELLYAPVYTFRIVDFLALYRSATLNRQEQEQAFIEAVDQVMVNVTGNGELREFVVDFLYGGFELLGMEKVIDHIAMNYMDEACESDVSEMVRERKEAYRMLDEGAVAPDFVVRDMDGRNVVLSELGHPYVLVVFWASTCGHCREVMPELHRWYLQENDPDLEVVAVSIDTSRQQLDQYLAEEPMSWITAWEPLGWTGKVASDYHIYATPSMLLLNQERMILDKLFNFRQFRRAVARLED